jgi:hypothetical protein
MHLAYLVVTIVVAALAAFSGLGKMRRDPKILLRRPRSGRRAVKVFPHLAAGEFCGALGLVLGLWWPHLGVAAGIGLVVYVVRASVSHVRMGDGKGLDLPPFMLIISVAALALRVLAHETGTGG